MANGQTCYYRGDLVGAEEHLKRLQSFAEGADFRQFPGAFAIGLGLSSLTAWTLGHADSARERIANAVVLAGRSKNPYDLAFARFFESSLYQFLREPRRAEEASVETLAICIEHGFSYGRDLAHCLTGWARAQLGSPAEGVELILKGLGSLEEIGARLGITDLLTLLAEAQALDGATSNALGTLQDALQANAEEGFLRPQILTLRGELRLKAGEGDLAEADFRDAIASAETMRAKAWELRASTRLARLLCETGKRDEARAMLAEIYNWFTEGFDTADLKDAKALLDELNN